MGDNIFGEMPPELVAASQTVFTHQQ